MYCSFLLHKNSFNTNNTNNTTVPKSTGTQQGFGNDDLWLKHQKYWNNTYSLAHTHLQNMSKTFINILQVINNAVHLFNILTSNTDSVSKYSTLNVIFLNIFKQKVFKLYMKCIKCNAMKEYAIKCTVHIRVILTKLSFQLKWLGQVRATKVNPN